MYNNREYHECDLRRYVNMSPYDRTSFYGQDEVQIFNFLSKEALAIVILQMAKEVICHMAMHVDPKDK